MDQSGESGVAPIQPGSRQLLGLRLAMFLCGFSTFSIFHGIQALLPALAGHFAISSAHASWALSITMLTLACALLPIGMLSDRYGRRFMLLSGLGSAAALTLAAAWAPGFGSLLVLRGLAGIALAGVPAVALAYLSEEVAPHIVGRTIALYAAGNAVGGVSGRLLAGMFGDWSSWRLALALIGVIGIAATLALVVLLPRERQFRPARVPLRGSLEALADHCRNRELRRYFFIGFVLMGVFISIYTYLGYRLAAPPFELRAAAASQIFLFLLLGIPAAVVIGPMIDRAGPHVALGAGLGLLIAGLVAMLSPQLWITVLALGVFTAGYFAAYMATNSTITRRAPYAKASAAALFLCFFYTGGGIVNVLSGYLWESLHWRGVIGLQLVLMLVFGLLWLAMPRHEPALAAAGNKVHPCSRSE